MRHRRRRVIDERLISALLGVALTLCGMALITARLSPLLFASARAEVQNALTTAVARAADDGIRDAAGLTRVAADAIAQSRRCDVAVPVGTLTGVSFLYGRGPNLRMRVLAVGSVRIEDTGRITAELTLFLPWSKENCTVSTTIP